MPVQRGPRHAEPGSDTPQGERLDPFLPDGLERGLEQGMLEVAVVVCALGLPLERFLHLPSLPAGVDIVNMVRVVYVDSDNIGG
jgi:hypothetical protein